MTSTLDKATPKALHEVMAARGLTQNTLAATAGVSQPYVSQALSGQRAPSLEWLNTVAMALALSAAEKRKLIDAAAQDAGFEIDLTD